jgi:hypothetical protein
MIRGLCQLAPSLSLCATFLCACESQPSSRTDTSKALTTSAQTEAPARPGQLILVTGDSVGHLRLVANRADLERVVRIARDTTEEGDEGMSQKVALVALDGDTVRVVLDEEERVFAYFLRSPRFQTRDSLGVGTSLNRLLHVPGVYAITGEGQAFVRFPQHCGLQFRLSDSGDLGDGPDSVGPSGLSRLAKDTHISEVQVSGCRSRSTVAPPT